MQRVTRFALILAGVLGLAVPALAQPALPSLTIDPVPQASGEQIFLSDAPAGDESWNRVFDQVWVRNVSRPSIYPVRPMNGRGNGKSVIVVPGGGYQFVSIESEGFRVAERLAAQGYTAFVLKYRPNPTPVDSKQFLAGIAAEFGNLGKGPLIDDANAVDDLAAAIRMVSQHAKEWNLDPDGIGVVGFSAGSRTAIRLLEQKDEAKLLDHVGLIYPPMMEPVKGGPKPDLFMAIAVDDPLFQQGGLGMLDSWLKQSSAVEFHLFSGGSHGFGMFPHGTTSDHWIDDYLAWLALQ